MQKLDEEQIKPGSIPEVVRSLQRAKSAAESEGKALARAIVFVGAGCSRSAGVPLASEIAQNLVVDLAKTYRLYSENDPDAALRALTDAGHFLKCQSNGEVDWYAVYDEAFSEHYRSPDSAREIFKKEVNVKNSSINWAHLCIGELVARGFFSTVMTTNFDLLALQGLTAAGVIPVVSDGLESLSRIDGLPEYPQLIQLNGSIHSYRLRNRPDEIEAVGRDKIAASCFRDLVRNARTIVFVGYAGRERAIMDLLSSALTEFYEKELYWCLRGNDPSSLSEGARVLLSKNPNARIIMGQDADVFFYQLSRGLGVGAPRLISDPFSTVLDQAERIALPDGTGLMEDIRAEVEIVKARINRAKISDRDEDASQDITDERALEKARRAKFRGDDHEALAILESRINPDAPIDVLKGAASLAYDVASATGAAIDIEKAVLSAKRLRAAIDKKKDPEGWAAASMILGNALDLAAMSDAEKADAKASIECYQEAVDTLQTNHPLRLGALNNMAVAYSRSGDMNRNISDLEKALDVCDRAINEIGDNDEIDRSFVLGTKANVYLSIGEIKDDESSLEKAIDYARASLSARGSSGDRASSTMTLASGLALLGRVRKDRSLLQEAVDIYSDKNTLSMFSGIDLVGAHLNRANSLFDLGQMTDHMDSVRTAIDLYEKCAREFRELGLSYQTELSLRGLSRARKHIEAA